MIAPIQSFLTIKRNRPDYGIQFEILVAGLLAMGALPKHTKIDGGANAGLHTINLGRLARQGNGQVHSFEPVPRTFVSLVKNIERNSLCDVVQPHCYALSDKIELSLFDFNTQKSALSSFAQGRPAPDAAGSENIQRIEVCCVPLDNIVFGPVDVIKLDLEGADFLGIRGARRIISESHPLLIFENGRSNPAARFGYTKDDFFGFFSGLDYSVFDLHGKPLTPETWTTADMAFEFCAISNTHSRKDAVMGLIEAFWETCATRPVLSEWKECVRVCSEPIPYFNANQLGQFFQRSA